MPDTGAAELSVIVPARNEATRLPLLLAALKAQQGIRLQLIVADGASSDATAQLAGQHGALVISCAAGRSAQMNAAREHATAPWLLFVHADSLPSRPDQLGMALRQCQRANAASGARVAGHFALEFTERPAHSHRFGYCFMQEKSALNRRYCFNGDQGLLIHADYLRELGGFDESLPYFEDLRIGERIHASGRFMTLPGVLETSARRFEQEGWLARYRLMGLMVAAHGMGLDAFFERARGLYQQHDNAQPLRLTPYLDLLAQMGRELGWRARWRHLYRLGRFARWHWWQLWFRADVALRPLGLKRSPFLWSYDHMVHPLIANPVGDAVAAMLAWLYSMVWLRLSFRLRERSQSPP